MNRPLWWNLPGRCRACGLHIDAQGHRLTDSEGNPTGCTPTGPLGLQLARAARDTGMARTVEANPAAVAKVDAAIMRRVRECRPFSANTIRAELADLAPFERPVIGARMRTLGRRFCEAIGEVPSSDPATHGKKVTVWRGKATPAT